jgi:energy-coupling factor transporter ATP-binding protein EcfA2
MSKPITKIGLNGFRGATTAFELEFDPQKSMTMLFGESGSGKSTILDAVDVVCNGTVGCLGDVSVGQSAGKYLCAIGFSPATLRATIHSGGESWTGALRKNVIDVTGPTNKPYAKILRRSKILELILAQPHERYKALRHFMDIGIVEQSEGALEQKINDTNSGINEQIADKGRMSIQLNNFWEAEHRPGPGETAMAWAQNKVETGIAQLNTHLERLKAVVAVIDEAVTAKTQYMSRVSEVATLEGELAHANEAIATAPSVNAATAVTLLESLEKAKAYIEAEAGLDKCPICQRPIGRDELLDIVSREFSQLSALKDLADKRKSIQKKLDIASALLTEAKDTLVSASQAVHDAVVAGDMPGVTALDIRWPDWTAAEQDMPPLLGICERLDGIRLTLEEKKNTAQRDVNQFNSISEWWRGINGANHKVAELDRIFHGLKRAYDIVHNKRVTFVQGILDSIAQEANRLFQAIHPGEAIGLERLKIEEERRGSVSQSGVFHGHNDIPPQAVFSESHMDTLGFCVWLALAKCESPGHTVLLVDDIFSSVDAPHLGRIIDLLSTEAQNFLQVIVATHYRLWWDRCQNAQGIQRIHLGQWNFGHGIAAQNMPLVTDQLRKAIANPVLDRQAVSSKAGILLESILDELTLLYECSLPRNELNQYTLGALLNGCVKLFTKHNLSVLLNSNWNTAGQPENWQASTAKTTFDRVNAMLFIRNQVGCHFSLPGMEIPDNDVREFGKTTIELFEALTCPNCGCLASKVNTGGTALRCSCSKQTVQMTPVALT